MSTGRLEGACRLTIILERLRENGSVILRKFTKIMPKWGPKLTQIWQHGTPEGSSEGVGELWGGLGSSWGRWGSILSDFGIIFGSHFRLQNRLLLLAFLGDFSASAFRRFLVDLGSILGPIWVPNSVNS